MIEPIATGLSTAALVRMAVAMACCAPGQTITLPICGDPDHVVSRPVKRGPTPTDDTPAGCHAVCGRKLAAETADDCPDC